LKAAAECAKEYDMALRKASDSAKYLADLQDDKKKSVAALKKAPKDASLIKKDDLLDKALAKAERDDDSLKSMVEMLETEAADPLRFFDALNKGTFVKMATEYAWSLHQLQMAVESFTKGSARWKFM
jgi:hypothetical protein